MKARIFGRFGKYGVAAFIAWNVVQAAIGIPIGVKVGLATWAAMQNGQ